VDESSTNIATNIALSPCAMPAGRPEEREGLREGAQENWGKNITLISSIRLSGMGASMSIQGSSDTESFSLYMREILAPPPLEVAQIILMDTLSVHTLSVHKSSKWLRELIAKRGALPVMAPA